MFWKRIILLSLFLNTIIAIGLNEFSNDRQEKNLKLKEKSFNKRSDFTYFLPYKYSKNQIFLKKLIYELEQQVDEIQEIRNEKEEAIKRLIINKYLVGGSRKFLNDFWTIRY